MSGANLTDTLRSGLGRRILGMFMLAALLPVIFTAYLSYNEVHRGLKQEVAKDLKENGKSYGVEILARLSRASRKANTLTKLISEPGADLADHVYLLEDFEAIWLQDGDVVRTNIVGAEARPVAPGLLNHGHLRSGKSQLIRRSEAGGDTLIIATAATPGQSTAVVMFHLDSRRIWGPRDNLPYMTQFCVLTTALEPVFCTGEMSVDSESAAFLADTRSAGALAEYATDRETFLLASWQLFLDGMFAAPALNIVAGQPESYALQSSADFRYVFPPALALVFILVAVFSLHLIGKSLIPLNRLKLLARQYASGELDSRVRLRSGDEFQDLGDTFNFMAGQLGTQIDTLKAMSDIDRLILAGAEFEEVGEKVLSSLVDIINCESAGVIARDPDSPAWAKMITSFEGSFSHERIELPKGPGNEWCQPRQVEIGLVEASVAPYKERFQAHSLNAQLISTYYY